MTIRMAIMLAAIAVAQTGLAQDGRMVLPGSVEAGAAFSIQNTGSEQATLYILGFGRVLTRHVQQGETASFPAGSLCNAGRYVVVLVRNSSSESGSFDVTPASPPAALSFLAKPSRLPAGIHDAITGAVYVFDIYYNLVLAPSTVSFELVSQTGAAQTRAVATHYGAAWVAMDSTAQQGTDRFVVRIGDVFKVRVVNQVPGDPCGLKMSARQVGPKTLLVTDPVRDCNGNHLPDGTIVTFTATYSDGQSTVDVPLKRGIAQVQMTSHSGATLSVASGVVTGNQIRSGN